VTRKSRTASGGSPKARGSARGAAAARAKGNGGARKAAPARRGATGAPASRSAAPRRPAAAKPAAAGAARGRAGASAKPAAVRRTPAARTGKAARTAPAAARTAPAAARPPRAADGTRARLESLQQEKSLLQEQLAHARAELDSALAEAARLRERTAALETDAGRGGGQREAAGAAGFDNGAELDDDLPATAEDDLDGAAGFFDRMDEIRARRNELDRERTDREMEQSEQPFWLVCPKCGDTMEEQESENIKLERCETCGGLYLDRGEVDLLLALTTGADGPRRLHNMLKF